MIFLENCSILLHTFSKEIKMESKWHISSEILDLYRDELTSYGLNGNWVGVELLERMVILDTITHVLEDERRAIVYAQKIFEHLENRGTPLSHKDKTIICQGTLLTDIGKTGSPYATVFQQFAVTKIFSFDDPDNHDPRDIKFRDYLKKIFGDNIGHKLYLSLIGMDKDLDRDISSIDGIFTFRDFIDKHTIWGFKILMKNNIPLRIAVSAMSHHFLEGVNPYHVLSNDGKFCMFTGENKPNIGLPEVVITLLDKYDAIRTRSHATHVTAIDYLTAIIDGTNPRYTEMRRNINKFKLYDTMRHIVDTMNIALRDT